MAKRSKKQLARQAVAAMCRPEGVSACKWLHLQHYLQAVAEHYPKAYPSQATLAAETGFSVPSIQRYQKLAVELGLLLVKPDAGQKGAGNNLSKTNQYHIVTPPKLMPPLTSERCAKPTELRSSGSELRSPPPLPEEVGSLSSELAALVHVAKFDPDAGRQVGQEVPPRLSKTPPVRPRPDELVVASGRRTVPKPKPRRVLAWAAATEHFGRSWREMRERLPSGDSLRLIEPMNTRGHCRTYLNSQFFGPQALTPKSVDEVVTLIDFFVENCYRRRIRIKEGQTAWMAFTGNWTRKIAPQYHNAADAAIDSYVPPKD